MRGYKSNVIIKLRLKLEATAVCIIIHFIIQQMILKIKVIKSASYSILNIKIISD